MEKINFCSAMQPKSLKEFPEERCEFCADYYRAADVDALLASTRALVETANAFFNPTTRAEDDLLTAFREQKIKAENVRQALAEVEPFLKEVRCIEEKD